jgi:BirA family transcriptional regulator, biotin operon repressor / biotin---[acetyl-CoA-carboxylase] ligase
MSGEAGGVLAARLAARGQRWSAPLFCLASVDSSSRWLKDAARQGALPWTVVVAEEQTAGRGRRGRPWQSPRGNLHLSVLVPRPSRIDTEALGLVSLLVGTVVARALEEWRVAARLKWPNDVRVGGRKLAGILVEGLTSSGTTRLVIGIGVNVNAACRPQTDGVGQPAQGISLRELLGRELEVVDVAAAVLAQLATCYDAPDAGSPARIVEEWRRRAEDWWGRPVSVRLPDGALLEGILRELGPDGALLIEDTAGGRRPIVAGDVEALRLT